jgi:hypothetical protein
MVELATYRVPTDPASPAPVVGYVLAFSVFYERGGTLPHRFFHSLLQFYGLELHHLTPSGILHITTFVTLCEAYIGIEPHLNPWNYFFRIRLWSDSDAAAMVWGSVEIYIRTGLGIDPYFYLSVSNPSVGLVKEWFFLRNDAKAPLPVVMVKRPAIQPSWCTGWLTKIPASCKPCTMSFRVYSKMG